EAMAEPDPIGQAVRYQSYLAAEAPSRELLHALLLFYCGLAWTCRNASLLPIAAAMARLRLRAPSRMGMMTRSSAASCTCSGTPADSRPNSNMSRGWNTNRV